LFGVCGVRVVVDAKIDPPPPTQHQQKVRGGYIIHEPSTMF